MQKLLFYLILLFLPAITQAQWVSTNGPSGGNVYDIKKVGSDLWAGTEGGLYISSDNGQTWTLSQAVAPEDNVHTIAIFPGEIILGVVHYVYNGGSADPAFYCYRSTDGGQHFTASSIPMYNFSGIIASFYRYGSQLLCKGDYELIRSADDGQTWESLNTANTFDFYVLPKSGTRIIAGDYYSLWKSEDLGSTWTFIDSILYLQSVYADNDLILVSTYNAYLRSTDFGQTWQIDSTFVPDVSQARRGDQGELWIPGQNILRSTNDGQTWTIDTFNIVPLQYLSINNAIQDGNGYIAAAANGIFKTTGSTWLPANNGLNITKVYAVVGDSQGTVFASTNAGNFRLDAGSASWQKFAPYGYDQGPGYVTSWLISGTKILAIDGSKTWRSLDNGQSWTNVTPTGQYFSNDERLVLQDGIIYVPSYNNIWYSADFGDSWQSFNSNPPGSYFDDVLKAGNTIFVLDNDGNVFRSKDSLATWTNVYQLFSPGAHNGNRLLFFNNRIYAIGRLETFTSADNGDTWEPLAFQGIPAIDMYDLFPVLNVTPVGSLLFATVSFNGVYVSGDGGANWQPFNDGLSNLRGRSLAASQSQLLLGTSTGGVFRYGINFQNASGQVYNDLNDNGVMDPGEPPVKNIIIAADPLHYYTASAASGAYSILASNLSDTIRAVSPSLYATVHPPFYVVDQTTPDLNFGIHWIPNVKDLQITATSITDIRPGFESSIALTCKNIGTTASDPATAVLVLPAGLTFLSADYTATQSGDSLFFNLGPLDVLQTINITVSVHCETSLVNGQVLSISSSISPVLNDANPADNLYDYREPVVASHDPNEKTVRPLSGISPDDINGGKRLEYTIRFENTGDTYATFIRIVDTLSPLLDIASLEIVASSHPVTWSLRGGGIVEFNFQDIYLQPSSYGGGLGNGFVKYSIRCRRGLPLNTAITNTAHVYFDYNAPVTTNTTLTTVQTVATSEPVLTADDLAVSPNPATRYLHLTWKQAVSEGTVRLFSPDGKLVLEHRMEVTGRRAELVLPELPFGVYRLQWVRSGYRTEKEIVIGRQ